MLRRLTAIFAIAVLTILPAFEVGGTPKSAKGGRTRTAVENEQRAVTRNIADTKDQIARNRRDVDAQINSLNLLESEIGETQLRIDSLSEAISTLELLAANADDTITVLIDKVEKLRADYAKSLRIQRRNSRSLSDMAYVFNARGFKEAAARIRYLKRLDDRRKRTVAELKATVVELDRQRGQLSSLQQERRDALALLSQAKTALESKHTRSTQMVSELRAQGSRLQQHLSEQQERARLLESELRKLLTAPTKPAPRKKTAPAPGPSKPAQHVVAGSFEKNRGRLAMPISGTYKVVSRFGKSRNPLNPSVHMTNNGINILGTPGANSRALFDGTVTAVKRISDFGSYYIVINHGNYSSAYAWIQSPVVSVNQKVKTGQNLGSVFYNPDDRNSAILHIEILENSTARHVDPMKWIK